MVDGSFAYRQFETKARDSCQVLAATWAVVKRYPGGDRLKIDPPFRRGVQKWIDERGMSHGDLAKLVGSTREAISQLLSVDRGPKTSALALPVSRITGVPLPGYEDDQEIASFGRALKRLRSGDPHTYARFIGRLEEAVERLDRLEADTLRKLEEISEDSSRGAENDTESKQGSRRPQQRR